jgi:hypothetical protein
VRNEIETKRNETERNQAKRKETESKRNETKSNETKRNEATLHFASIRFDQFPSCAVNLIYTFLLTGYGNHGNSNGSDVIQLSVSSNLLYYENSIIHLVTKKHT